MHPPKFNLITSVSKVSESEPCLALLSESTYTLKSGLPRIGIQLFWVG